MDQDKARELGRYLREARQRKGYSTRSLAAKAGVVMSTIVRVEHGERAAPRPEVLRAIAEALDLPLSDVFARAEYVVPSELPSFTPYLRAKYGELPPEAVEQLQRSFERIAKRHGYDASGPAPGEDET